MSTKYINTQTRMACLSTQTKIKPDIFAQLEQTIAERKRIMKRLEDTSNKAKMIDLYSDKKAAG